MAITIQQISPVAHLPLVLGVVRKLNVAGLIDTFCLAPRACPLVWPWRRSSAPGDSGWPSCPL